MTAAAVHVRGFGYRAATRDRWVPRSLSFDIDPGERILVLGGSGSGKSTVLRAMADLLDPSGIREGAVLIDGKEPRRARHRIGLMMQDPDAFLALDQVADDVAFGPQNQGMPPDVVRDRTLGALSVVGMDQAPSRRVDELSGGERQRVALAGVLAMQPGLVLLDEPTSQLDPAGSHLIRDAVGKAVSDRNTTLVLVEHRVGEWLELIDRVFILDADGRLVSGTVGEVMETEAARDTWLHPPVTPRRPSGARPRPGGPQRATPVLQAATLRYTYRGTSNTALAGVTCNVSSGHITAITGPNGSGKSTLARVLGGLIVPEEGSVHATAELLKDDEPGLLATQVGRWNSRDLAGKIGSVFQNPEHSFVAPTVREEVEIGPRSLRTEVSSARLLSSLALSHLADFNPFTLSGGEQRRLSVAAALATSPDVLILDEPTFGQDPATWRQLVRLVVDQRARGRAIVVVSHDREFVAAVADTTFRMERGCIVGEELSDSE